MKIQILNLTDRQVLRQQRTEYGKAIRKLYEAKKINERRDNMRVFVNADDGICNTLTTVLKDNLIAVPLDHI